MLHLILTLFYFLILYYIIRLFYIQIMMNEFYNRAREYNHKLISETSKDVVNILQHECSDFDIDDFYNTHYEANKVSVNAMTDIVTIALSFKPIKPYYFLDKTTFNKLYL